MFIDRNSEIPLYKQLSDYYKTRIINQTLPKYTKMPSIRNLARKHNISKTTIEKAYHQLQIEGYIQSQPKSGYYVTPTEAITKTTHSKTSPTYSPKTYLNLKQRQDFFDISPLRKIFQHVMHDYQDTLFNPPNAEGEYALRKAIHTHIEEERGVITTPTQIIIASGIQNHLMTLATLTKSKRVAYLVPIFDRAQNAFDTLNFERVPCQTIDQMLQAKPDFIYISPANLYPSGEVLSIRDRIRLINYIKTQQAYIIEDDYNHIFRYNAYQIPSIQGLAKGQNVIYIGSFSRNLLLSLRTSYMVLPDKLYKTYTSTKKFAQTVSKIDQLALATYIEEGHYTKHLKKLSTLSKRQRDYLVTLLDRLPTRDDVTITGLDSNLHILIHTKTKETFKAIQENANQHDYYIRTFKELNNTILLPYSGLTETQLETMLKTLLI